MDMTGDNLPEPSAKEWERLYLQAVDYGEKQAARVAELEAERAEAQARALEVFADKVEYDSAGLKECQSVTISELRSEAKRIREEG